MRPRGLRRRLAGFLAGTGITGSLDRLWRRRLTVLAYHRIADARHSEFSAYRRTASATPAQFAEQLRYLAQHCTVVSLDQVIAAARDAAELPDRAVLITFDDGYRDNVDVALPLLEQHRASATVFLATDFVGSGKAFFWDVVADLFFRAPVTKATLPLLGERQWTRGAGSSAVAETLVEKLKHLTDGKRAEVVASLGETLRVHATSPELANLCLGWDDVRRGASRGLAFGSHTCTHAILPGLSQARARRELVDAKSRLEAELGRPVTAFAYPNGDCDVATEAMVRDAGYAIAFSMRQGPSAPWSLRHRPWSVRRVPVYSSDTPETFAAKLVGVA